VQLLLVEDDPLVARAVARQLRHLRVRVHQSSTIRDAVRVDVSGLDGAILDEYLPDGRGSLFLAGLRDAQPHLPVLLVSGAFNIHLARNSQQMRAFYCPKPIDHRTLASFVDHVSWAGAVSRSRGVLNHARAYWRLSPKQARILELAISGVQQRADLARILGVEEETVKTHVREILRKTGYATLRDLALALYSAVHGLCEDREIYRFSLDVRYCQELWIGMTA